MGFFRNLINKFKFSGENDLTEIAITHKFNSLYTETYINYLAFYSNVNRIANAFCKCSFETFTNNENVKDEEWYTWNVQPNRNQSAYVFKNKLITTLYENNEALVVEMANGDLYVADSYNHDEYALFDDVFKNVTVCGLNMGRTYKQNEVLFFKLNDINIKTLLDGMMNMYKKLMDVAVKAYSKSKGGKIFVDIDDIAKGSDDFATTYTQLLGNDFKDFFNNENAVIPLFNGYSINDKSLMPDYETTPKDIIDLMNNAIETNAIALNVPTTLAKGNVQDTSKVIDEFLTFCIDPIVKMIEEEILRKRYGIKEIKNGNYLKINSKSIKHVDIFSVSTSIEKLISSACFTVNDIRKELGLPVIDEDWANEFFMTKNFSTIEELMKAMKGGGKDENVET